MKPQFALGMIHCRNKSFDFHFEKKIIYLESLKYLKLQLALGMFHCKNKGVPSAGQRPVASATLLQRRRYKIVKFAFKYSSNWEKIYYMHSVTIISLYFNKSNTHVWYRTTGGRLPFSSSTRAGSRTDMLLESSFSSDTLGLSLTRIVSPLNTSMTVPKRLYPKNKDSIIPLSFG